jgi:hypothetical protein
MPLLADVCMEPIAPLEAAGVANSSLPGIVEPPGALYALLAWPGIV